MKRHLRLHILRFRRDESGAAMVEFLLVSTLFFFLMFAALDFGVFASFNLMAEKATQVAARTAAARPAACAGVPERHIAGTADPLPRFGTNCRAGANICAAQSTVTCQGNAGNATASEIWDRIGTVLPTGTQISDLTFTYEQDPAMGYLGGPYTAIVTVELSLPTFTFLSPITGYVAEMSGGGSIDGLDYRTISISLPAEDLALGTDG